MHFHRAECVSKQKEHLSVTHYKYNNAKATKSSFFDSCCQKTQIENGLNRNRGILGKLLYIKQYSFILRDSAYALYWRQAE